MANKYTVPATREAKELNKYDPVTQLLGTLVRCSPKGDGLDLAKLVPRPYILSRRETIGTIVHFIPHTGDVVVADILQEEPVLMIFKQTELLCLNVGAVFNQLETTDPEKFVSFPGGVQYAPMISSHGADTVLGITAYGPDAYKHLRRHGLDPRQPEATAPAFLLIE
jgi:hypothetical protein